VTVKQAIAFLTGLPELTEVSSLVVSLEVEPDDPVEEPT